MNAAEIFEEVTGYPLSLYLSDFTDFVNNDYPRLQAYYTGQINDASASIAVLNDLLQRTETLMQTVRSWTNFFTMTDYTQLFLSFEGIRTRLNTAKNLNLYLRSNRSKTGFEPNAVQGQYYTKQFQTLPDVNRVVEGNADFTDGWIDTFNRSGLSMLDIDTPFGNLPLTVNLPTESQIGEPIQAVIGDTTGVKILGRDLDAGLVLQTDLAGFSDYKVLNENETFGQAIEIVFGLSKGDYPTNPYLGIDKTIFIGNKATSAFNVPVAVRAWSQVADTDDTIAAFRVTNIRPDGAKAALFIDVEVLARYGEGRTVSVVF